MNSLHVLACPSFFWAREQLGCLLTRRLCRPHSHSGFVQAHDLTHYECTSLEYQQKISRFLESMELPQEDQPEAKPSGRTTEARVADPDGDDAELVAKICRAKASQ